MGYRTLRLVPLIALILLAGCHDRTATDDGVRWSNSIALSLGVVLGGIVGAIGGAFLIYYKKWLWGVILIIAGIVATAVVGPGLFMDEVKVSKSGFVSTHGFWWSRVKHEIGYVDVATVTIREEVSTGRRGRKNYSYFFDFVDKKGTVEIVPIGDLMKDALPDIAAGFRANGIVVMGTDRLTK